MLTRTLPARRGSAAPYRPFTLIELLTVVSIIAIILAMIMPALSKAREKARGAACGKNLATLSTAFRMYGADNEDYIACAGLGGKNGQDMPYDFNDWSGPIGQFYVPTPNVFLCPSSRLGGQPVSGDGGAGTTVDFDGHPWQPVGSITGQYAIGQEAPLTTVLGSAKIWAVARKCYTINTALGLEYDADRSVTCPVKEQELMKPEGEILLCESMDELCAFAKNNSVNGSLSVCGITDSGSRLRATQGFLSPVAAAPGEILGYRTTLRSSAPGTGNCLALPSAAAIGWDNHMPRASLPTSDTTIAGRSYYLMADGAVEFLTLVDTLNTNNFKWGNKLYGWIDTPRVLDSVGGNPVQ